MFDSTYVVWLWDLEWFVVRMDFSLRFKGLVSVLLGGFGVFWFEGVGEEGDKVKEEVFWG